MQEINTMLWIIATVFLVSCGIFYTFKLHFIQFNFSKMFQSMKNKEEKRKDQISPFKTLTLALAARIGVGSLAGIALGLYKGGIGIIFWVWLSALITIPNSFVESTLAVIFHEKGNKYFKGGPAYYISKGLGYKKLAVIYAIVIAFCYLGCFLSIQANTISRCLLNYLNVPTLISGIIISVISYIIISRGLSRISSFTSFLVPIMGIIYMVIATVIIILNIEMIPEILGMIIAEAFNFKAFGWGIISSIIIGVQRGIFSSEAGIGTGAVASGASESKNPCNQGYIQMLGIYFTSFVICTSTAMIILTSNIDISSFTDPNGIEITLKALESHLGTFGIVVLIFLVITFAFSTVVSGYYYGESNLRYLMRKRSSKMIKAIQISAVIVLLYGSVATPSILWNIADIGVALLAIINTFAIFRLRNHVITEVCNDRE